MTVAYDTSTTKAETTGDSTWSHTAGAANIKGALVYIIIRASNTPPVGVTYGGAAMVKISEANDTNAETGNTTAWFLTNPGNGSQTVSVDVGASQVWGAIAVTCTGAANLKTYVGTPIEANAANPSIVITVPASWVNYSSGAIFSGLAAPTSVTAGTNYTVLGGVDFAGGGVSDCAQFERLTTGTTTGDPTVAFTSATDDVAMVVVAMGEVQTTNQAVDAAATFTAALVRVTGKVIAAAATLTAALVQSLVKSVSVAVTATLAPGVVRITGKIVAATATLTGALVRSVGKPVAVTATLTAALARLVGKPLAVTVTLAAGLARQTGKTIAASITATAGLVAEFIAGSSGTIYYQTVAAVTTLAVSCSKVLEQLAAGLSRQVNKPLATTVTHSVVVARAITKLVDAVATFTVSITKRLPVAIAAAATFTVALSRSTAKTVAAAITFTADVVRKTAKTVAVTVTATADMARAKLKVIAIAVAATLTAALSKSVGKPLAATVTLAAGLARKTAKTLAVAVTLTATAAKQMFRTVAVTVTFTVSLVAAKFVEVAIAVVTTLDVALSRTISKTVALAITLGVAVRKGMFVAVSATVSFTLSLAYAFASLVGRYVTKIEGVARTVGLGGRGKRNTDIEGDGSAVPGEGKGSKRRRNT